MKRLPSALRSSAITLCSAVALLASATASADPPDRAARLAQVAGVVSFSPAGEDDWAIAEPNRPVTTGDRIWSDAGSHVELQIGDAAARLGANTSVAVLNLDDRIGQFQLAQGTLNLRVRRIQGDQFYEVDTPTLAFSVHRAGDYRVDVDPSGNTTVIQVRAGQGEAWGEGTAYVIDAGQQYSFIGEGLRDYRYDPAPPPDDFDRWCLDRNRREDAAVAARYVSPDMVGYADLDEYGTWRSVEGYGTVWVPTQVAVGWVPYHYGRWAWVEPWGWTWIDDTPWGFAPFHYGRWAYLSQHWCWVPGPIAVRPVYAPALVAFIGGAGFSLAIGTGPVAGVAWFPLGVGEVYRPSYAVSRNYFTSINVSNTVINNTYVTNIYNNPGASVTYRNREVAGAVTAVPSSAFASGERVERHAVAVQRDVVAREQVTNVAAVTPSRASVIAAGAAVAGAAAVAAVRHPPAAVLNRTVVARTAPPAPPPSFASRASMLSSQPGRPLDADKLRGIGGARSAESPKVKVVTPSVTPRVPEKSAAKGGPPGRQTTQGRAVNERPGAAPSGVPQPPAAAQERFKGGPPQGQAGQQEQPARQPQQQVDRARQQQSQQRAQQERFQQERTQQEQRARQQEQLERAQQQQRTQQQSQQRGQQERFQQQGRAQQQQQPPRAQQQPQQQPQQQQERAQQQQQQRAQQQGQRREEPKGKSQNQDKDKDKDRDARQ